ncbi:CDP-alcohol phosphatidyltransferase family protein [Irregularibacter muris]|uniref:Phosphatidylglycerophosphate synthase n=1 Tax=Irregularibacter muris TaxID=1796619 RepID=A0AAE3HFG7_9FIRM|nr:CDP-alcohol phosphatidyltransferase family protein [Irregularibacter muris]MCR1899616.1 CDP-alcohol phosphatidyltransferase family protein [Irregularibacter muris]
MNFNHKEWFTIPNILSCARIILIPIFISSYIHAMKSGDYYIPGMIIILSGLTDLLDGLIARKFNQITELGKVLDPIADKLTQGAIVFTLMFRYRKMWILVALFMIKELSMAINSFILFRRGKKLDGSLWFGKLSTTVFYATMTVLIIFPRISLATTHLLMGITGIFLLLSFVMYTKVFLNMHHSDTQGNKKLI